MTLDGGLAKMNELICALLIFANPPSIEICGIEAANADQLNIMLYRLGCEAGFVSFY
jgi:hypothetical protein